MLRNRKILEPDQPVASTRWVVTTLLQGDLASSVPTDASEAFLVIGADGSVSGSTGCRELSGTATVAAERPSGSTTWRHRGAVPAQAGGAAELDEAVMRVLAGDVTYAVDGPTLTLKNTDAYGLVLDVPTP